jgi:hypothetical protein
VQLGHEVSVLYSSMCVLLVVSELLFFSSLCLEKWPSVGSVLLKVFVPILLSLCSVFPNLPFFYIVTTLLCVWLTPVPCSWRQQVFTFQKSLILKIWTCFTTVVICFLEATYKKIVVIVNELL